MSSLGISVPKLVIKGETVEKGQFGILAISASCKIITYKASQSSNSGFLGFFDSFGWHLQF